MPRPRKPYLQQATTRHGARVWYVRLRGGDRKRVRIRAAYGTPEFDAEYEAAMRANPVRDVPRAAAGTLEWAVRMYRESSVWLALSVATRRQRENVLRRVVEDGGDWRLAEITRTMIVTGREKRAATPAAARHFLDAMRGLFAWAIDSGLVATDPTHNVRAPRKKGGGHPPWADTDMAAYEARWPRGTRERVAYDVLLYTGLRRGDAVCIGRPHVRDGVARIKTEKTGERVAISIVPELEASLAAGPCGDLTWIAGERGKPMVKESFGTWFAKACKAANVAKSAHGLRKAAATRAANNGATESELEAMFGWRGGRMASLYTRAMDREKLSINAAAKLEKRTPMGAPENTVGRTMEKG